MADYLPILLVGAILGAFTLAFLIAYARLRKDKAAEDLRRTMSDKVIVKRLLRYAKPYWKQFVLVGVIMLFSIVYDLVSPLIIGHIEKTVSGDFELPYLLKVVAVYAGILAVSMVCTYFQAMILQKTGQKILSQIRMDVFTHVEQPYGWSSVQ